MPLSETRTPRSTSQPRVHPRRERASETVRACLRTPGSDPFRLLSAFGPGYDLRLTERHAARVKNPQVARVRSRGPTRAAGRTRRGCSRALVRSVRTMIRCATARARLVRILVLLAVVA